MSKLQILPKFTKFWLSGDCFKYNDPKSEDLVKTLTKVINSRFEGDIRVTLKNITEIGLDQETIIDYLTRNNIGQFEDNIACYGLLVEDVEGCDSLDAIGFMIGDLDTDLMVCSTSWVNEPEPLILSHLK